MPTTDTEYRQVYEGIVAVASHCDGAQTLDGVGFSGQDTLYGRRVASVPFDQWTDAVKTESARIALKYKVQIERYTGVDMAALSVVQEANNLGGSIRQGRDDARTFERRVKKASKIDQRRLDVLDGRLAFHWVTGDPDFGELLQGVQKLPGRFYNRDHKCNQVSVSQEAEDFALLWDIRVTEAAEALLRQPRAPKQEVFNVWLHKSGRIVVEFPYDREMVEAVRNLPGRDYQPPGFPSKCNAVNACQAVLDFADRFNLNVHPDAQAACETAQKALDASVTDAGTTAGLEALMEHVSRIRRPEDLPEVFETMLRQAYPELEA